jgi:hypothetical protein
MINVTKELVDFQTHCFETGQLQVGELISSTLMYISNLKMANDAKTETYIELIRLSHESLDSKDAKIAELKEQLEAAMTFNVDVVRCLSRIAVVENHNEVPAYIDMSRRCIKTIEAKQAKSLKEQE